MDMTFPQSDAVLSPVFTAFGDLDQPGEVCGFLETADGRHVGPTQTRYLDDRHWLLVFEGLEEGVLYDLTVLQRDSSALVAKAKRLSVGGQGVDVYYPEPNTTVPASFSAVAQSDVLNSPLTTYELRTITGTVINGSLTYATEMGGGLYISVAFSDVPAGTYELTIGHQNGTSTIVANVTVPAGP